MTKATTTFRARTVRRLFGALLLLTSGACKGATGPSQLFHVRGTVINRQTMAPVPGIEVSAYYEGGCGFAGCYGPTGPTVLGSTRSDANGKYALDFTEGEDVCNPFLVGASSGSGTWVGIYTAADGHCSPMGEVVQITVTIGP